MGGTEGKEYFLFKFHFCFHQYLWSICDQNSKKNNGHKNVTELQHETTYIHFTETKARNNIEVFSFIYKRTSNSRVQPVPNLKNRTISKVTAVC